MNKEAKQEAARFVEERAAAFETVCDAIWGFAELRFQEHRSSALQQSFLEDEGFRITSPIGPLDTAFVAEYGQGKPVIALVGEFDALPGLSQVAGLAEKKEREPGGNGHGCGHHLLGTAAMEAAVAVKRWMETHRAGGTVRYYGCPGEERGCGKVYMIRAGAFQDVDAALSWHPDQCSFRFDNSMASCSVIFSFHGRAAHAAVNPHLGRSALDAAELANIGVNFLREHLPMGVSIQYAFADAGCRETNIIPDYAAVEYTIRALSKQDMDETYQRVKEIASGAAMMTGTQAEQSSVTSAYSNILKNETLLALIGENEALFPLAGFTEADLQQAAAFSTPGAKPSLDEAGFPVESLRASADFGDVSYVVPSAAFAMTTFAVGTALHSWSAVAQGKLAYAHKGMHRAAKILAATALDLFLEPEWLARAQGEFEERTGGRPYASLLPPR